MLKSATILYLAIALTSAKFYGFNSLSTSFSSSKAKILNSMKPFLEKMEEGAKLSDEAKLKFCIGEHWVSSKLAPALSTCGISMNQTTDGIGMRRKKSWDQQNEDRKCILETLGWSNDTGPIRGNVITDLAMINIGESMTEAEKICFDKSEAISAGTVAKISKGDCSGLIMSNTAATGRINYRGGGFNGYYIPNSGPNSFPGRYPFQKQANFHSLTPMVKSMVYFGCLRRLFDEECAKEANAVLIEIANGGNGEGTTTTRVPTTMVTGG